MLVQIEIYNLEAKSIIIFICIYLFIYFYFLGWGINTMELPKIQY